MSTLAELAAVAPKVAAKIEPTEAGCWAWTACTSRGYGKVRIDKVLHPAHRVVYERLVGPIPDGLVLDHLCRNRACVNPAHLEPVTQRENLLRGETIPAFLAARTTCDRGHEFDSAEGHRRCRKCHADAERRARQEGRR